MLRALLLVAVLSAEPAVLPPARELWREAMDYHRAKDPARAMEAFLRAYHADPAVLGLDSEGLIENAIDHLKRQLDVRKDDLVYTFKLAEMLNLRGHVPEAIAAYRRVIALNPNSPMAQLAADEAQKLEAYQKPQKSELEQARERIKELEAEVAQLKAELAKAKGK